MTHGWIVDVLADMRVFARTNGLPRLADQLDDALLIAAAEVASTKHEGTADAGSDSDRTRTSVRLASRKAGLRRKA